MSDENNTGEEQPEVESTELVLRDVGLSGKADVSEVRYDLGPEALGRKYDELKVYPLLLTDGTIYQEAITRYVRWQQWVGWEFDPKSNPWVPVGHMGPALILGHTQDGLEYVPPPIPRQFFQPVLLTRDDYTRQLSLCDPLIKSAKRINWMDETSGVVAPRADIPEGGYILPRSHRAALQLLVEYAPHSREDYEKIEALLGSAEDIEDNELPTGYLGACYIAEMLGAVADPTMIRVQEATAKRIPESCRNVCLAVAEYGKHLWLGASALPQAWAEDQIIDTLGGGWDVHWLLLDGARSLIRRPESAPYVQTSEPGEEGSGRTKTVITPDRTPRTEGRVATHPDEIRLTQKELAELERYNPKRNDRDGQRVFLKYLAECIKREATDMAIEPGLDKTRIRGRFDGDYEELIEMPNDFGSQVIGCAKELLGAPAERHKPLDLGCTIHYGTNGNGVGGIMVNTRISVVPIRRKYQKIGIRFLPKRGEAPTLESIFPKDIQDEVIRSVSAPSGMILVCGPTGSGKTTTMNAMMAKVNTPNVNITTMEDPVEYQLDGANQMELDIPRGVSWQVLLSAFLRQDPDIGGFGEIRDGESANQAMRLSLTGHVVLGTVHAMDCPGAIARMLDLGTKPGLLANAVNLVISQRLVKKLCKQKVQGRYTCTKTRAVSPEEKALFEAHGLEVPASLFEVADSCQYCNHGYRGQVAAVEILPVLEEVKGIIQESDPEAVQPQLVMWMERSGYRTVFEAALILAAEGVTTIEEAKKWQPTWEGYQTPKQRRETSKESTAQGGTGDGNAPSSIIIDVGVTKGE